MVSLTHYVIDPSTESAAEGEDVPQECGVSDVNEADLDPVSDAERELDKEMRLMILLKMFQLACAMVS